VTSWPVLWSILHVRVILLQFLHDFYTLPCVSLHHHYGSTATPCPTRLCQVHFWQYAFESDWIYGGGFRSLKALNACGQTCALVTKAPRKLSSLATQTLCKYLVFKNVYILRDVWGV